MKRWSAATVGAAGVVVLIVALSSLQDLGSLRAPEAGTSPAPSGVPSAPVAVTSSEGPSEPVPSGTFVAPPSSSPTTSPSLVVRPSHTATPAKPTARPTQKNRVVVGIASTYGPGFNGLLALPEGPGHKVKVCGPKASITKVSNDTGPNHAMQLLGRVVDLDVPSFQIVCGCAWTIGLVKVSVTYLS